MERTKEETSTSAWYSKGVSYDKVIEIDPNEFGALDNKSYSLYRLGKYDEAFYASTRAIEINPRYGNAGYNRAIYRLRRGEDLRVALEDLRNSISSLLTWLFFTECLNGSLIQLKRAHRFISIPLT